MTPRVVAGRVGGARGQLGVSVADAVEVPPRRGAFRGSLATSSGGGATETVTVTFTPARPVVTLSDPAATTRVSTGTFTTFVAPFRVHPADAVCTYRRIWDPPTPASVGLNGNSGPDRSLRALVVGIGEVIVDVRCAASGLDVTERVVFTALSPDACERPITLGAAAVSGTWTSSCTSTQRGDNQTHYYAKSSG